MEHQVFVPVPADDLRAVLRDPARVARCVPGLQQDADTAAGPLSGRLKVRIGGSTVTYRGALTVTERDPGHFTFDGEGTEVRGSGSVKFLLDLRLVPVPEGTRLDFTATATADGRAAGFPPEATATAVQRLLDRAAGALTLGSAPDDPVAESESAPESEAGDDGVGEVSASLSETDAPPPSLDPFLAGQFDGADAAPQPPAEAAHARRTMIGRSAEEVDHAPPRGRYAPVPAPASATAGDSLRWIAPAAAIALASAVVIGRALRRRR
ncbi:SRPBCC family protein [Streptomyces sp. NPDC097617]|uniref:SRPBCC family protein n=1 Tax=Streptomyces sp. NPDC097617 TaxID=3366091 RepID=UPI003819A499